MVLFTFLENMVAPVFYKLLYMSLTALVVGMIIILIRRFTDKLFSPFWKYAMWMLVLVALLMPWRPQSNLALMNTTARIQEVSFHNEYTEAQAEYHAALQEEPVGGEIIHIPSERLTEAKVKADSLHVKSLIFDSLLPALWLFGVAIIGLFMMFNGLRLGRKIKSSVFVAETARYENILQNCKMTLGIKRRVRIILQCYVKTPALFGLFRPKIILPEYAENLSDEHLEYVILHELSHLKRGDGIVNTLLLALQTIYWFNPLTWVLFKFIREDMELANDAAVLKGMGAEEQKEYSLSLVAVLAGYSKPALAPRLLCMVDSEKNMERRINMIKLSEFFKRRKLITAIAGILVIAITATLFLTVGEAKPNLTNDENALMVRNDYSILSTEEAASLSTEETTAGANMKAYDLEMFNIAARISSDRFLLVEKNMTMRQVMDTLGNTCHIMGQGPSAMYYIVDDAEPLKIDFVNMIDPYPFSGYEMKQYFNAYGAVTFKTIYRDDVKRLKKGMKIEDIVKELGNTIDVGSGRHVIKYSVWEGMSFTELTFNSGGGELPYTGEEICNLIFNESITEFEF